MSTAESAFETLLHSPCLPEYAERIERRLADERTRRNQFYEEMTDDQKVEFIDGEIVLHSPARHRHLNASRNLTVLLDMWVSARTGLVHCEKALCVFPRNDYEPDIVYFGPEKAAGIHADTLKFPVPDFIVEILSESTQRRDRGVKFEDYAAHGVREYWIVDSEAENLEQYLLAADGGYQLKLKANAGEVESAVLEGFMIPIRAIFDPETKRQALARFVSK